MICGERDARVDEREPERKVLKAFQRRPPFRRRRAQEPCSHGRARPVAETRAPRSLLLGTGPKTPTIPFLCSASQRGEVIR